MKREVKLALTHRVVSDTLSGVIRTAYVKINDSNVNVYDEYGRELTISYNINLTEHIVDQLNYMNELYANGDIRKEFEILEKFPWEKKPYLVRLFNRWFR